MTEEIIIATPRPAPRHVVVLDDDTDMLRSCFGGSASRYPAPKKWAEKAVPFMLALNSRDNGKPLSIKS